MTIGIIEHVNLYIKEGLSTMESIKKVSRRRPSRMSVGIFEKDLSAQLAEASKKTSDMFFTFGVKK